jgi:hypothetical protein
MSTDTDLAEFAEFEAAVAAAPAKKAAKAAAPEAKAEAKAKDTVRIILDESDDIPRKGLFVGHNGIPYVIPTSREVDIPLFLKEILDNAVVSTPIVNPETRQVTGYRSRIKHTYRVVA